MKIYQETAAIEDLKEVIGSDYALFAFSGSVPTSIEELPFNEDASIESLGSLCEASLKCILQYGDIQHSFAKIDHVISANKAGIYTDTIGLPGMYSMVISNISISDSASFSTEKKFDLNSAENTVSVGGASSIGNYLEFQLREEVEISKVKYTYTDHPSYGPESELQAWNSSTETWVTVHTFSQYEFGNAVNGDVDVTVGFASDRFRLNPISTASSVSILPILEFITTTQPSGNNTPAEITWGLLKPIEPSTYMLPNSLLWADAGGPNDSKDIALQNVNLDAGESITIMNFKLRAAVLGDLK